MNAKYFSADTLEQAQALALEYFACDPAMITIDIIKEGEEGKSWEILAIEGDKNKTANSNAAFKLFYEEDGVYLEIYAKRGRGQDLDSKVLPQHLGRKSIANLSIRAVQKLTEVGYGRRAIAPPQPEYIYGEDLSITISSDDREADARLLMPEPGGQLMTLEAAKQKLIESGVVHGIDEPALINMLNAKEYHRSTVVAKATEPVNGIDGKLVFHFSTDERTGSPQEVGHGRVDYRLLDLYVPVTEGQLLITKTEPTEGTAGISVRGNPIQQKPGKEIAFPRGKNVKIDTDKAEMYAACSGMVDFAKNMINVSNIYKVNGDCDLRVGNIDFDGSVHITGTVRAGSVVKATDRITVDGGIEAATLIAQGNIEVKGGMSGSSKGHIEAGGSVSLLYVERGTVIADGPIKLDVSIHSRLEAGGTIHAQGKRGAIIGGHAAAAGDITANYIGAISNTKTEIEVGFMPRKRTRIALIEKELERLSADETKLDQLDNYLTKSKETMEPEMWNKLHLSGVENRKLNTEERKAYTQEIEMLKEELANASESRVHALRTAFNGVRITIGSSSYRVTNEIDFVTFRSSNREIVFGPCEYNAN